MKQVMGSRGTRLLHCAGYGLVRFPVLQVVEHEKLVCFFEVARHELEDLTLSHSL